MGSGRKKEREKIKAREGEGERGVPAPLPSPPLLFIAIFTSHRSPLSERLERLVTCKRLIVTLKCDQNVNT